MATDFSHLGFVPDEPTSPYGNGAKDLAQPAPQTETNQVPTAPKMSPAPMPQGDAGQPQQAAPTPTPQDFGFVPDAPEQQGPVEETPMTGSAVGNVVKKPDGKFGIMESDGKVRDLSDNEKKAASYMAKALRIGGPTVGGMLGTAGGSLAGFPGAMVGGATGSVLGGESVHPAAQFFEQLAGESPQQRGGLQRGAEALGGAAGVGVSKVIGALGEGGASMLPGMATAESGALAPSVEAGAQSLNQAAAQRLGAAQEANLPIMSHQVNQQNPAVVGEAAQIASGSTGKRPQQDFLSAQADVDAKHLAAWEQLKNQVGPSLPEEAQKGFSLNKIVTDLRNQHQEDIGSYQAQANAALENEKQPVMDIIDAYKNALVRRGYLNPDGSLRDGFKYNSDGKNLVEGYKQLQQDAGAMGGKGMTLQEVDELRKNLQTQANFDSPTRTVAEQAAGEISHQAVLTRDDLIGKAFDKIGDPNSAEAVRALRDKYQVTHDAVENVSSKLEQDPSLGNAVKAVVKKNNPQDVQILMNMVKPEQEAVLKRAFIDQVVKDKIDTGGRVNATAIEKELSNYDPKTLQTMLGDAQKPLKTLLNYAKGIQNTQIDPQNIASNKMVQGAIQTLKDNPALRAPGFIVSLFKGKPDVNNHIYGQMVKEFPVDMKIKSTPIRAAIGSQTGQTVSAGVGAATGSTLGNLLNSGQNRQ